MIPWPLLALMLVTATPLSALTLPQFEGRWRGEGAMVLGDEPEQRFRCQIRLNTTRPGESFFSGRCATAQAAQSLTYMLTESETGALSAENRAETPDTLPAVMTGTAAPGLLDLRAESEALFELRLDGDTLVFRIEGRGGQGPARGQARLLRQN